MSAITNCTMLRGHGSVVLGSEMAGGISNVMISNCGSWFSGPISSASEK